MDKQYVERKLEVMRTTYEQNKMRLQQAMQDRQ